MKRLRIVCVSDGHGHLPYIPECDLLLIAGDMLPTSNHNIYFQHNWLHKAFRRWLDRIPARDVVSTWGNHDFIGERMSLVPHDLRWTTLIDEGIVVQGVKVWGSPHQKTFPPVDPPQWAFNLSEAELAQKWAMIPADTNILLLHSPPYMAGDWSPHGNVHAGSPSLRHCIEEIQPELVVCGHLHSGYGLHQIGRTTCINASHCDEGYRPVNKPIVFDLEI